MEKRNCNKYKLYIDNLWFCGGGGGGYRLQTEARSNRLSTHADCAPLPVEDGLGRDAKEGKLVGGHEALLGGDGVQHEARLELAPRH